MEYESLTLRKVDRSRLSAILRCCRNGGKLWMIILLYLFTNTIKSPAVLYVVYITQICCTLPSLLFPFPNSTVLHHPSSLYPRVSQRFYKPCKAPRQHQIQAMAEDSQYLVSYGPDSNCTLAICPVEWSVYQYRPSLGANTAFIVLFGLAMIIHIVLGIKWRSWAFLFAMFWGCVSELIGYGGRVMLWQNPFSFSGFLMQICTYNGVLSSCS